MKASPRCQALYLNRFTRCDEDRVKLVGTKTCPQCSSAYPETVRFCQWDGARLVAESAAARDG